MPNYAASTSPDRYHPPRTDRCALPWSSTITAVGKEVAADRPLRCSGVPTDIASAVAYLASEDSSWVTGHILTVDGGLTVAGGTA
ncbi:SDR family oxidoreductase [Streptomyces sp. NPDC015140]|uniref:SDR family oxidoreductase n=1 Tax=Streptomyces TaxID=1883 RepID=UPI0036FF250E